MSGGLIHPDDLPRIKELVSELVGELDPQAWTNERAKAYGSPNLDVHMQTEIVARAARKLYLMGRLQEPYVGRDTEKEGEEKA